ncbi:zinc finger protein 839 isoform X2 [Cavia porcellus]|uniref:zinc finger protein 839 isoform X2 n=1 Tax=Cavia porcellus TaxID=10141 RepID=UPI002FE1EA02
MADAESETEGGSERGGDGGSSGRGGGGRAPPRQGGSAALVAPLGPEQLWRVLEQVTRAQLPPPPPPPPRPPFVVQDAAQRLRDAAQQAALQRAPGAEPSRLPRLLPPQQLEAICVKVTSGDRKGQEKPTSLLAITRPQAAGQSPKPGSWPGPVGLGVQPVGPQGPMPAKRVKATPALSSQGSMPTPVTASDLPVAAPAGSGSAHPSLSPAGSRTGQTEKLRKSSRVKTRSGRISRPPKYKARDYRFIKTEDLADGRLSDSDDYLELSSGDEEEQRDPRALFTVASCALRPRAFRCQACDKAYIGQGGLARHWRLNPGHSGLQPKASPERGQLEAGTGGPALPELCIPAVPRQDGAEAAQGSPQCVEVEEAMVLEPENASPASGIQPGDTEGLAESSAAVAPPNAYRSRAQLQELLLQSGPEDLMELVLPRLVQVVTVYEFLLVKVAESLGIPGFLRKTEARPDHTVAQGHSPERAGLRLEEAGGWQRLHEAAQQAPAAQRPRQAALPIGDPERPAALGGGQETPGLGVPTTGKGFAPPAIGAAPALPEGSHGVTVSGGFTSVSHAGWQLTASADSGARRGSAGPGVLCGESHGTGAPLGEPKEHVPDAKAAQGSLGAYSTLSPAGEATGAEPGDPGARPMAPLPEEISPIDIVPVDCTRRTGPDRSPLSIGSHSGDLKQLLHGLEVHISLGDLECEAAVGDSVAFEISNGCPEVLCQGQEQILVQTASGVLLSHLGTTTSQENTVLVTGAGGPGLHIRAPEGIPLVAGGETLTVQTEPSP